MKKLIGCCVVALMATMVSSAFAGNPYRIQAASGPSFFAAPSYVAQTVPPAPAVDGEVVPQAVAPMPQAVMPHSAMSPLPPGAVVGQPVALFHRVKYKDLHEMHPCAVPKIIAVKDPCACHNPCSCCAPPACVYIQICVPPCACEEIDSNKSGTRIEYDYGKYEVDVRVKDGYIEVDYQD